VSILLDPEEVRSWWTEADDDPALMASIAVERISEKAATGDHNAQVLLDRWTRVGARHELKAARQSLRQVVMPKAPANGHSALPVRLSIAKPDGTRQLVAWETLTYAGFGLWVQEYRAHHRTRTNVLKTAERLLEVWSQRPEVMGDEALRMAGIDPQELSEAVAI
jgi:hypothetical protein